jgi:hypothetical protein
MLTKNLHQELRPYSPKESMINSLPQLKLKNSVIPKSDTAMDFKFIAARETQTVSWPNMKANGRTIRSVEQVSPCLATGPFTMVHSKMIKFTVQENTNGHKDMPILVTSVQAKWMVTVSLAILQEKFLKDDLELIYTNM